MLSYAELRSQPPTPDRSGERLVANFVRSKRFAGGQPAGSTAGLVGNSPRLTPRGVLIEPLDVELLTNSRLEIDLFTGKPFGWSATTNAILTILENGVDNIDGVNVPFTRVQLTAVNVGAESNIRLSLEPGNGLEFGVTPGPFFGREYAFGGRVTIEAISNAGLVSARLTGRDITGALVGVDGSDGRTIIDSIGVPTDFLAVPTFDPAARFMAPVFTMLAAANATASMTLKISNLHLGAGKGRGTFIGTSPPTYAAQDFYPNPTLAGATAGSPGTRPTGWLVGSGLTTQTLAAASGTVDIVVNIAAGATGTLRLSPLAGVGAAVAVEGEQWVASVIATVLDNPSSIIPAISIRARDSGGALLDDGDAMEIGDTVRVYSGLVTNPAGTAYVNPEISFGEVPPSGTSITLRIATPRLDKLTVVAGTGPVTRPDDRVSWTDPASYALPFTETTEAEHRNVRASGTLKTFQFGANRRMRLITGQRIGAVWETLIGGNWTTQFDLTKPALYPAGQFRIAASISSTSTGLLIAVGFPDEADSGYLSAPIVAGDLVNVTQPTAVYVGWSGNTADPQTADTAIRTVTIQSGATAAANLPARTRRNWLARFFAQPVAFEPGLGINDVPAFIIPRTIVVGDTFTYVEIPDDPETLDNERVTYRNRYVLRTSLANGNMADTLVNPPNSGAGINTPATVTIINGNTAGTLTLTTPSGTINNGSNTFTLAAGQYGTCCTNGVDWWVIAKSATGLEDPYSFLMPMFPSIYGPQDPIGNPSRSKVNLEYYTRSQSVISPIRQQGAYLTREANLWSKNLSRVSAAKAARCLYDWCLADYWQPNPILTDPTADPEQRREAGNAANTFPTQAISNVGAYIAIRDAGVLTAAQDAVIRGKISRWVDDLLDYDGSRKLQGLARVAAGDLLTGLQNHYYSYGYAMALCAVALNRADLYDEAVDAFKIGIQDVEAVPGSVGAFPNEMVRGSKGMIYQNVATLWMSGIAMPLRLMGFDVFGYSNGAFLKIVNYTVPMILSPQGIRTEQERMLTLNLTGLNSAIVPSAQESLSISGGGGEEGYPGESKTAWVYLMYRLLATELARWRPDWREILSSFINCYSTSLNGGLRDSLYPTLLQPEATAPGEQSLTFDNPEIGFDNSNIRFDQVS